MNLNALYGKKINKLNVTAIKIQNHHFSHLDSNFQ